MKTRLCKPVLVETKEPTTIFKDHSGLYCTGLEPQTGHSINSCVTGYKLILISLDPDEKIEVGDMFYDTYSKNIGKATVNFGRVGDDHAKKIIATQFQLSPEYIQQFIEEYNKGEVKDVEIEMEYNEDRIVDGKDIGDYRVSLTNGFVTIIEKKLILYTEEDFKRFINQFEKGWLFDEDIGYINLEEHYLSIFEEFKEWFNKNKKK